MAMRISLGSGATLATNLLNGEHLQIISPVTVNPLPAGAAFIGLASVFGTVNVSGGSILTTWNSGATVGVTGTVAATQSGTWNAGITGLISLASGTLVGLNAGNNNIGDVDVASIAAGDNNIGNVDVVTLPALAAGANLIGLVTVANTITETNSSAIKTAVETLDNAISGSEMQVDVVTMPTTTVTATDLDIRDLSSGSDSVAATQSGTWNTGITGLISLASGTLVGLNPSANHIGSVSIFGSITANTGMTTLFPGPNQIGSVTISNTPPVSQSGTWTVQPGNTANSTPWLVTNSGGLISLASGTFVSLNTGTNHIGSVSIFGSVTANTGMTTLFPGPNQIGSVTVSNVVAVTQSGTWDEVGINDSGNSITVDGSVGITGLISLASGTFVGLNTGTNYVGLASVNIGGSLPAGTNNIGDVDVLTIAAGDNNIGNVDIVTLPATPAGGNYIGLATVIPAFISNYTSFATIYSAAGSASLLVPPSGQRWILKDLMVGALGRNEIKVLSGAQEVIPYIALATTGGYISNFGDTGLRAKTINESLSVTLQSAATITIMANVRFE